MGGDGSYSVGEINLNGEIIFFCQHSPLPFKNDSLVSEVHNIRGDSFIMNLNILEGVRGHLGSRASGFDT